MDVKSTTTQPVIQPTTSEQSEGVEKGFFYSNWSQVKSDINDITCMAAIGLGVRGLKLTVNSMLGLTGPSLTPASLLIGLVAQRAICKFALNALRYVPDSVLDGKPRLMTNIGLRFGSFFAARDVTHFTVSNLGLSTVNMTSVKELLSVNVSYIAAQVFRYILSIESEESMIESFKKGQITEINQDNFKAEIEEHDGPVILDVYSNWCPPCRALAPIFSELSLETEAVKFAKFNLTEEPELAEKLGIRSIPTLLFYKNGEIVDQNIGLISKEDLQEKLNKNFELEA